MHPAGRRRQRGAAASMGHRPGVHLSRPAGEASRSERAGQRLAGRGSGPPERAPLRWSPILMSGIPAHVASARTWSDMLAWWRGRTDPAVITRDGSWTGAELLERAAGAAQHLRSITSETGPVPALITSGPGAFAYLIGGAAGGRPPPPLGPRLTPYQLGPCIDNLSSDVLLVEREFAAVGRELTDGRERQLMVIDVPPLVDDALDLAAAPDAIAFVLHTSGTTGQPKPVECRQDRLAQRTRV